MSPSDDPQQPPAGGELQVGWYRDPDDPKSHRFWNGQRWSTSGPRESHDGTPPDATA